MDNPQLKAKGVKKTDCQTINASPEVVFPLLCPVREAEWLDGWEYEMIYSKSGLVEEGAVFSTANEGEEDTVWIVTQHDPDKRLVEFTRFTHQSRICVLKIAVRPKDKRSSYVEIGYTYTGISTAGNEFIENLTDELFPEEMMFWENSVNHFLKTGEKLKRA
jgi:hypothetical protein